MADIKGIKEKNPLEQTLYQNPNGRGRDFITLCIIWPTHVQNEFSWVFNSTVTLICHHCIIDTPITIIDFLWLSLAKGKSMMISFQLLQF